MKKNITKLYKKSKESYYKILEKDLKNKRKRFIVTVNPETLMMAEKDLELKKILADNNISFVPDGIAVVKASKWLKMPVTERIAGVDIAEYLLKEASILKKKVYLFGSKQEVIDGMKNIIEEKYSGIKLVGATNGYIEDKDKEFENIKKAKPDVVMVALGIPHQEKLIYKHLNEFDKGIFIGVGGSFDVLSGTKKRAPKLFIKTNTEWLYRIVTEPKRLKRFWNNNVKFMFKIRKEKKKSMEDNNSNKKNKLKKILSIALGVFVLITLISMGYIYYKNEKQVAILGYHGVLPQKINTSDSRLIVNQEDFEKQLKYLKKHGYRSMTLDEFNCWKNKKCKKAHRSVLITFDDGYMDNYLYAFELLKKYYMNAVVFYVGKNINSNEGYYMNKETIEKAKVEYPNIEFASHSYGLHENFGKTYEEVNNDIMKMKDVLDSKYYAYPHGSFTDEYISALKDNGYLLAFTFGPGKNHRKADIKDDNYKIPRLNISKDMPMYKFTLRLVLPV